MPAEEDGGPGRYGAGAADEDPGTPRPNSRTFDFEDLEETEVQEAVVRVALSAPAPAAGDFADLADLADLADACGAVSTEAQAPAAEGAASGPRLGARAFDFDELDAAAAAVEAETAGAAAEPSADGSGAGGLGAAGAEPPPEVAARTFDSDDLDAAAAPAEIQPGEMGQAAEEGALGSSPQPAGEDDAAASRPRPDTCTFDFDDLDATAEAAEVECSGEVEAVPDPRPDTCTFDFDDLDAVAEAAGDCGVVGPDLPGAQLEEPLPAEQLEEKAGEREEEEEEEDAQEFCRLANRVRTWQEEDDKKEDLEAERQNMELQIEMGAQMRLQKQDWEVERGTPGAVITVEVQDGKTKTSVFFCDAMNDALARLQKVFGRDDKVVAAGAQGVRDRVNVVVAFLSGLLQHRFSRGTAAPCGRLVGVFQDPNGLCAVVRDWLDDAVKETPLEYLADVDVGQSVRVLKDLHVVLKACRDARIDRSNDALRRASLGQRAQVLEKDASDGTVCCNVPGVGDVWFAVAALAADDDASAGTGAGGCAERTADSALRAAAGHLRALASLVVTKSQVEKRWLNSILTQVCKALAPEEGTSAGARPAEPWRLPESCFEGDFAVFVNSWLTWTLANRHLLSRIARTSPLSGTRLLYELRARFQAPQWQERYRACKKTGELAFGNGHLHALDMTFAEQAAVIPKYGFAALPRGVTEMRHEMEFHFGPGGDIVVWKLVRDIHVLLDKKDMRRDFMPQVRVPSFHTVGDSHCTFGWPPFVVQHFQGSMLCYNITRVDVLGLQPAVRAGDAVCFCFGEIDCRCHVHKHCTPEKSYQDVIDEIIARYFSHLKTQVKLLPEDVQVFIYNVVPPVPARVLYPDDVMKFLDWGSDEERRSYALYFNKRLRAECGMAGYHFFDVYNAYTGEDGFLIHALSDGKMHIKDGRFIVEYMRRIFSML